MLEFNDITSIDVDLVKVLKYVDSTAIILMCYYKDKNQEYYFLHTDGSWIYMDMIVNKKKNKRHLV